jgi:FMN phosphatase YigB (HAD superfamily)
MAKLHSFDIFDTVLVRRVAVPSTIFRFVGIRIAHEMDSITPAAFVEHFETARIQAEQSLLLEREEATLDGIWQMLHRLLPFLPGKFGQEYELDEERKLLAPNALMISHIAQLRAAGARVIFTSDTYLPLWFIRSELIRHGAASEGDNIYVSSDIGLSKRTGALFNEILRREKVAAGEIVHYGDNLISDFRIPRRLKLGVAFVSDAHLNIWENAVVSTRKTRSETASLLCGSMRSHRLSDYRSSKMGAQELISTFLGPVITAWVAWTLAAARKDGIRRLYFTARDSYLAWRAARIFAPHFGNIDCRYLRISRRTVLVPSTVHISQSGMPWLQRPGEPQCLGNVIEKLDLTWEKVARAFSSLCEDDGRLKLLASDYQWAEFWRILQTSPVRQLFEERIQRRRPTILAYLRSVGFFDRIPVALVDVGWHLMVQAGLRRLVTLSESSTQITGYYLGLFRDRVSIGDSGDATALFYQKPFDLERASGSEEVFRRIAIVEHVIGIAPHGTVTDYLESNGTVEPVSPEVSDSLIETTDNIAKSLEEFCVRLGGRIELFTDTPDAREIIDCLLRTWCRTPEIRALNTLAKIDVSNDSHNFDIRPLIEPWNLLDSAKTLVPRRWHRSLGINLPRPVWPEAAFARSGLAPSMILRLRRKVSSDAFPY